MRLPHLNNWRSSLFPPIARSSALGEISLIGTVAQSHGIRKDRPRTLGQWALVYLVEGTGSYHDSRGRAFSVKGGDVILIFPELAHAYGPPPGGVWNELYICFRGPVFEAWREAALFDIRRPVFSWKPAKKGLPIFQSFLTGLTQKNKSMPEALAELQCLLAKIFIEQPDWPPTGANPPWLRKAVELLDGNTRQDKKSLRTIASECGVGYENFRLTFARHIGQPPGRYALVRTIERAQQLLLRHHFTNKELADLLGFHDEYHFAKTFKKIVGRTPRQEAQSLSPRE